MMPLLTAPRVCPKDPALVQGPISASRTSRGLPTSLLVLISLGIQLGHKRQSCSMGPTWPTHFSAGGKSPGPHSLENYNSL